MSGEVVGVINVLVIVELLSKHLESGVAFADNAEAKFVFLFQKDGDSHDNRLCDLPSRFEPSYPTVP